MMTPMTECPWRYRGHGSKNPLPPNEDLREIYGAGLSHDVAA